MLNKFRWTYHHTPTYENYKLPKNFALCKDNQGQNSNNFDALEHILKSLTRRHKELLRLIAKECFKLQELEAAQANSSNSRSNNSNKSKGLLLTALQPLVRSEMICQTTPQLETYLRELEDARLIKMEKDRQGATMVVVDLSKEVLEKLVA